MTGANGTALYAFSLGLVGALNPCGFPLLPAYTSFFVGHDGGPALRATRALAARDTPPPASWPSSAWSACSWTPG